MITWDIPDLDLGDLSLWLAHFDAAPGVLGNCLSAAIGTIPQNELVLSFAGYLIDSDKVVVVAELVGGWEVSVLQVPEWHVRI